MIRVTVVVKRTYWVDVDTDDIGQAEESVRLSAENDSLYVAGYADVDMTETVTVGRAIRLDGVGEE